MRASSDHGRKSPELKRVTGHHQNGISDRKEAVEAAAALFREHGAFIRATIRFLAKSEFQVDDLFQQFFISLVNRPVPAGIENVKSYLYRAITNDIVDSARRRARQRKHFEKLAEELRNSIHKRASAYAVIPEHGGDTTLTCLTRQLRKREAEAVMLRYQDDRSIPEIARIMGVDGRTVSHYLAAALRHLRRICAIE
jgi:RNA polymerase sigma factor (sigma-70 family)